MKKSYLLIVILVIILLFSKNSNAADFSQSVILKPGWNIVSTPRVLDSHSFSAPEVAENFDIFVLDPSNPAGWSTMAGLGQTEFQPLFGYFINNKTGTYQTLTFNYKVGLPPNQKLFQRVFSKTGWYSIGVANPTYSQNQCSFAPNSGTMSKILDSLSGHYSFVIDFTDADFNKWRNSVSVANTWKSATSADLDNLNDPRDFKGYAIFITKEDALYSGFQNDDEPITCPPGFAVVILDPYSPSGDVVDDSNDVPLARFTVTAYGEPIKVETFTVRASPSDSTIGSLRNGRILINGSQYGSTATLASSSAGTSYTVNYTFQPGVATTVEVRADLHEASGTDNVSANDVISVVMLTGSSNGQGTVSASTVNVPTADVESNNVTVKSGSMTLAKYSAYANQTVTVPASNLKLGHFVLTGGSAENVNVNTINVGFNAGDKWTASQLSNVSVKVTDSNGNTIAQTSPKSTVSSTASTSYSVSFTLPKSTTYNVEVWATVASFTVAGGNDTMQTEMSVSGTSAQSGATVTSDVITGQTLTAGTGSITSAVSGSAPAAKIVAATSTADVHAVDFTTTNDSFTIYEMVLDVDNGLTAASTVANVIVKDGTTVVANQPLSGASVSFTGLNIQVPANDTKTLTFALQFGNVGVGAATTAADAKLNLESFKAKDSNGSITTDTNERQGNSVLVHRSYPSVAAVSLPSTLLAGGSQTLSKFTITANGNTVGVKKLVFTITKDTTTALASASTTNTKIYVDGSDMTSLASISGSSIGAGQSSGQIVVEFTSEQQIGSGTSKTFELKHTISTVGSTGTVVTALNVGTSSYAAPNTYSVVDATSAKLVWTDRSASSHSESTADWMNDYLVKDSISQSLTK